LSPLVQASPLALTAPWQLTLLPASYKIPGSQFEPSLIDGEPALALRTARSYGTLVHNFRPTAPGRLRWQWRLDTPLSGANITERNGDDSALKVCVMFDQPLADMPLLERTTLRLARAASDGPLPAATLCYLWDSRYPAGLAGNNAYTARVRYIVLQGPAAPLGAWVNQERDVAEDFRQLFGTESRQVPPITAVAVGADSDNTQGSSLGYLRRLQWFD
jgi:hypothetical protein